MAKAKRTRETRQEITERVARLESENTLLSWYAQRLITFVQPDALVSGEDIETETHLRADADASTWQLFDAERAHGGFVVCIQRFDEQQPHISVCYLEGRSNAHRVQPGAYPLHERIAFERLYTERNRKLDAMAEAWNQAVDDGPRESGEIEPTQESEPQFDNVCGCGFGSNSDEEFNEHIAQCFETIEDKEPGAPAWSHISEIEDKRAAHLARVNFAADAYHCNIQNAACKLVSERAGEMLYISQYTSGATLWRTADYQESRMVPRIEV